MTREEILEQYPDSHRNHMNYDEDILLDREDALEAMKKYAEQEVKNALEAASEKAEIIRLKPFSHHQPRVAIDSILNAYKVQ